MPRGHGADYLGKGGKVNSSGYKLSSSVYTDSPQTVMLTIFFGVKSIIKVVQYGFDDSSNIQSHKLLSPKKIR